MTAKETNQLKEVQMEAAIPCKEEVDELVARLLLLSGLILLRLQGISHETVLKLVAARLGMAKFLPKISAET